MMIRTHCGVQSASVAMSRFCTPPVESKTIRAWQLLTWLASWRFICRSRLRSPDVSLRARTRSTALVENLYTRSQANAQPHA
jgi:hypothetical protein